ncbi:hypothetical protein PHYSODRAFT_308700 [Phytophthora sojae]|uniref:DUF659 domain-containing protein n=1 Tax=Phytophthora sojae (strain P6497) TaxID=1094619 RepID=G4YGU4_PHYSP|nr:hypothetical protein PHYSODRAFT_308700 [Phytophthora sojae]EGZ27425.1 hypothetical protein PHYSODRAFT_308700 [Phytophthora sojae]|eukprot:XP_009514700.1 hypothetical protein PHYSODRAFT_308700 [Phytophthora sojae]
MTQEMETIVKQALSEGWCIGAVITDNAGQCGRARRILALMWPKITFLFCFTHCINNIVKAVLKSSFSDVARQATAAVKSINASSSKWLGHARALTKECYGKSLALFTLCETRWNSMESCFVSLLRVRTSLVMLASRYQRRADFPKSLKVFSYNIFWADLSNTEHAIVPLSKASYSLQRDENTLADVVVFFRDMFLDFGRLSLDCRSELQQCVEVR